MNMKTLELTYEITEDLAKALFVAGKDDGIRRRATFNAEKLSETTRAEWAKRFGLDDNGKVHFFSVAYGVIYPDGSVDERQPTMAEGYNDFLALDRILQEDNDEDLAWVLTQIAKDEAETHEEWEQKLVKWQNAKELYETKKQADAKERQNREEIEAPIRQEYNEKNEKLKSRNRELAGFLEKLIRASNAPTLERAGLVRAQADEDQEAELEPEQQEALETCGLDC
jgi:hypothetical protein